VSWFGSDFEPALIFVGQGNVIETHEHKGDFKENRLDISAIAF
jgi:hypothetical protein